MTTTLPNVDPEGRYNTIQTARKNNFLTTTTMETIKSILRVGTLGLLFCLGMVLLCVEETAPTSGAFLALFLLDKGVAALSFIAMGALCKRWRGDKWLAAYWRMCQRAEE